MEKLQIEKEKKKEKMNNVQDDYMKTKSKKKEKLKKEKRFIQYLLCFLKRYSQNERMK